MTFNRLKPIAALFIVMFFLAPLSVSAASIAWNSYDKGLALAKQKNKKIYVNFHADWCGYCKKMEKETFVSPKVVAYLNEHFIAVRVNSDKEQATARKYNVRGLPANFFFTEQGEVIGNQPGYLDEKMFLQLLSFVKDEKYKKGGK